MIAARSVQLRRASSSSSQRSAFRVQGRGSLQQRRQQRAQRADQHSAALLHPASVARVLRPVPARGAGRCAPPAVRPLRLQQQHQLGRSGRCSTVMLHPAAVSLVLPCCIAVGISPQPSACCMHPGSRLRRTVRQQNCVCAIPIWRLSSDTAAVQQRLPWARLDDARAVAAPRPRGASSRVTAPRPSERGHRGAAQSSAPPACSPPATLHPAHDEQQNSAAVMQATATSCLCRGMPCRPPVAQPAECPVAQLEVPPRALATPHAAATAQSIHRSCTASRAVLGPARSRSDESSSGRR